MRFTDVEIINYIKQGKDDAVLKYLYKKQWSVIRNYVIKNNGSEEEAQDIFQDAIVAFYKQVKLGKYNMNYEIGGFIYSVSRNLWINKVKKDNKYISPGGTGV